MHFMYGPFEFRLTNWLIIIAFLLFVTWRFSKKMRVHQNALVGVESKSVTQPNTVAIIDVFGPILHESRAVPRLARDFAAFGGPISETIKNLASNDKVVGLIVRFDTPGGTVPGSVAINHGIEAFKKKGKPVFGHALSLCASGGVLAGVASDKLFAQEGSLIGSIGVAGPTLVAYQGVTSIDGGLLRGGVAAEGISAEVLAVGKGKAFGNPFQKQDPEVIANFRDMLNREYERFKSLVAKGRNLTVEAVDRMGAMIYDTSKAEELGLIDGVADEEQVKAKMAERLKLSVSACEFVRVRSQGGSSPMLSTAQAFVSDAIGYDPQRALTTSMQVYPVSMLYESSRHS